MSNTVYNGMTVEASSKEVLDQFLEDVAGCENGRTLPLCFNRIIPMPVALLVKKPRQTALAYEAFYGDFAIVANHAGPKEAITSRKDAINYVEGLLPDAAGAADKARADMERYGENNWDDWRYKNWGTSWEATFIEVDRTSDTVAEFHFETAHYFPKKVIIELVALYPEITFAGSFSEEMGEFEGEFDGADIRTTASASGSPV